MVQLNIKPYLLSEDVKENQEFEIIDEGEYIDRDYGTEENPDVKTVFDITIKTNDQTFTWTMNQTTQIRFSRAFGSDTAKWVGKKGIFELVKQNVFGKIKDVVYGKPRTLE